MLFNNTTAQDSRYTTGYLPDDRSRAETVYRPSLLEVNDSYLQDPSQRFERHHDHLYEATIEAYGNGVFETIPRKYLLGMEKFVTDFIHFMGLPTDGPILPETVVHFFGNYLDHWDLYFLFYDMPVSIQHDQMFHTYSVKATGETLDPEKIEIFRVQTGWDFWPYRRFSELLGTPQIQAWARGEVQMSQRTGQPITREQILQVLCEPVFGDYLQLVEHMSDSIERWTEASDYGVEATVESVADGRDLRAVSLEIAVAGAIACAAYLKSEYALQLLINNHPIYYEVLEWDYDQNCAKLRAGTDGECVLYGWQPYTLKTVTKHLGLPPGTCRRCQETLHCTKLLDSVALTFKQCGCGSLMDPQDLERSKHKNPECTAFYRAQPPVPGFFCRSCTAALLTYRTAFEIPPQVKCERSACPNTQCPHHLGDAARRHALNEQRRLMLT